MSTRFDAEQASRRSTHEPLEQSPMRARAFSVIAMAYAAGLAIGEGVAAQRRDLFLDQRAVRILGSLSSGVHLGPTTVRGGRGPPDDRAGFLNGALSRRGTRVLRDQWVDESGWVVCHPYDREASAAFVEARVVEAPNHLTLTRDLEGLAFVRHRDEGVSVGESLARTAPRGEELELVPAVILPDDFPCQGVELHYPGPLVLQAVVEDEKVAVLEQRCIVLSRKLPLAPGPDELGFASRRRP